MRELTKQIIQAYFAAKAFPYVLEGLSSRNNQTQKCADLVGFLLDNHGAELVGQLKSLQIVASLTADRDGEFRKAALNALATGYKILCWCDSISQEFSESRQCRCKGNHLKY